MHGVFLDRRSVDIGDLDLSPLTASLATWDLFDGTEPDQVAERIRNADVVVSNKVVLDRGTLAQAEGLRLICVAATGTNNVDLQAAGARGIPVSNVRGYATPAVVQHVFAMILALSTRMLEYHRAVHDGAWARSPMFCMLDFPIREIACKTLGIVGFGELGRAVARVAEAFGMQVLVAQRPGTDTVQKGRVPLDALLAAVDVLTLHAPLTAKTRGLIGAAQLARMKPDALLINTARGGIVDERALADALRSGRLGGAGVDVLSAEPPRDGNPLLDADIPNLIVTPHTAWASREARQRMVDEVTKNIRSFCAGTVRNSVRSA